MPVSTYGGSYTNPLTGQGMSIVPGGDIPQGYLPSVIVQGLEEYTSGGGSSAVGPLIERPSYTQGGQGMSAAIPVAPATSTFSKFKQIVGSALERLRAPPTMRMPPRMEVSMEPRGALGTPAPTLEERKERLGVTPESEERIKELEEKIAERMGWHKEFKVLKPREDGGYPSPYPEIQFKGREIITTQPEYITRDELRTIQTQKKRIQQAEFEKKYPESYLLDDYSKVPIPVKLKRGVQQLLWRFEEGAPTTPAEGLEYTFHRAVEGAVLGGLATVPVAGALWKTIGAVEVITQTPKLLKGGALSPEEFTITAGRIVMGGVMVAPTVISTGQYLASPKPIKIPRPSLGFITRYLRRRSTVIVRDIKTGKELRVIDEGGLEMFPGGKIDKGETARQAAKRELVEETGLKIDIKKFKKIEDFATQREKHSVFEVLVDKDKIKIKVASDVKATRWANPEKSYTGASPLQPVGPIRGIGEKGIITLQEDTALISARVKHIKDIEMNWKGLSGPERTKLAGEAEKWAIKEFNGKAIEGMKPKEIVKDYMMAEKGLTPTTLTAMKPEQLIIRRREAVPLKSRVPAKSEQGVIWKTKIAVGKLTGKEYRPGTFFKWQKHRGVVIAEKSRYDISPKSTLEYKGKFEELWHGTPGALKSERGMVEVLAGETKRGQEFLYFQPPTQPLGTGFLGISYLGIGKKSGRYEIGVPRLGGPKAYYTKAKIGEEIVLTPKALRGTELEVGAPPGTVFKVAKGETGFGISGKRVKVRELELVPSEKGKLSEKDIQVMLKNIDSKSPAERRSILNRIKKETGRDYSYEPGVEKIMPYKPATYTGSEDYSVINYKGGAYPVTPYKGTPYKGTPYDVTPYKGTPYKGTPYKGTPYKGTPYKGTPYKGTPYKGTPYKGTPYKGTPYKGTPYKGTPYKGTPYKSIGTYDGKKKKEAEKKKEGQAFITKVKRYGKWITISKPLPKGKALKAGAMFVQRTLGATFKIVPIKARVGKDIDFRVSKKVFRAPKGEQPGLTYVQRGGAEPIFVKGGRLAGKAERAEISLLRSRRLGYKTPSYLTGKQLGGLKLIK